LSKKAITKLIRCSGVIEVCIGFGHLLFTVLIFHYGISISTFPESFFQEFVNPEIRSVFLGLCFITGIDWIAIGSLLIFISRDNAPYLIENNYILNIALLQQIGFLIGMLIFIRFHFIAIIILFIATSMTFFAIIFKRRLDKSFNR